MKRGRIVKLDVREDLQQGRHPFDKIMQAAAKLGDRDTLELLAPLKPTPLIGILKNQGFQAEAVELPGGDWQVRFQRSDPAGAAVQTPEEIVVDARDLEPPEPLVKILEALARLAPGQTLKARTDRRPLHLRAQLEARGLTGESAEQSDGSFVTTIRPR